MQDRTTVVISHDLLTTQDADLIVVLDHGEIVERGRHEELLLRGGPYAELWASRPAKSGGRATEPVGSR